jgi:hypothetical protein
MMNLGVVKKWKLGDHPNKCSFSTKALIYGVSFIVPVQEDCASECPFSSNILSACSHSSADIAGFDLSCGSQLSRPGYIKYVYVSLYLKHKERHCINVKY